MTRKKVLVFGDSMIAGVAFDGCDAWEAHVECRWGATSEQLAGDATFGLAFLLAEDDYDAVVLSAGTNDPWHDEMTRAFVQRAFVRWCRHRSPSSSSSSRVVAPRVCETLLGRRRPSSCPRTTFPKPSTMSTTCTSLPSARTPS